MFEAPIWGADIGGLHLIPALMVLAAAVTLLLGLIRRGSVIQTVMLSLLVVQILAGGLLFLLLSVSSQPVHDAQTWVAHYSASFGAIVFWALCPVFAGPVAVVVAVWLKGKDPAQT